jgi:pyrimidine-nucleoside phosphorylase
MDQPLGHAVGNALEVREAIATLNGRGPADFREHCLAVAERMLVLGNIRPDLAPARGLAAAALSDGRALIRFRELAIAQGGDPAPIDAPDLLPTARYIEPVAAPRSGHLARIDARTVGEAAVALGAGRTRKGDPIDLAVGFEIHHKVGDHVGAGEALFTVHANDPDKVAVAKAAVLEAHVWSDEPVAPLPLFFGVIPE